MMKKSLYEGETWLGKPPEIEESRIEKTMEADVVVVGAGLAGVAAARAAAELGSTVLLLEKCEAPQARSGDFAVMDSRVADVWGRRNVDKVQIVNDLMRDMAYKVSQNILRRWAEEAGEAFDWYLEGYPDIPVLKTTAEVPPEGTKCWIQPRHCPAPESFENGTERFKCYQTTAWVRPTHIPVFQGNVQMLMQTGLAQCLFSAPVVKLLREKDGRVQGAVAQVGQDRYIKEPRTLASSSARCAVFFYSPAAGEGGSAKGMRNTTWNRSFPRVTSMMPPAFSAMLSMMERPQPWPSARADCFSSGAQLFVKLM